MHLNKVPGDSCPRAAAGAGGCRWFLSLLSAEESGELANNTSLSVCIPETYNFCYAPFMIPNQAIHRIASEHHQDMHLWGFFLTSKILVVSPLTFHKCGRHSVRYVNVGPKVFLLL